jgi:fructose-1-phosphate kinase PfkB-like protein
MPAPSRAVVTVTPNAALDRALWVDELHVGFRQLLRRAHVQAGGKGVNVSRVLARLGRPVRSIVVVGGETGQAILEDLARADLRPVAVHAPGESRTCIELLEERSERATQIQ